MPLGIVEARLAEGAAKYFGRAFRFRLSRSLNAFYSLLDKAPCVYLGR